MRVCYVASHAHGFDGWGRYTVGGVRGARARGVDPVLVTSDPALDPALEGVEHHALLPPLFTRRFETPRSLLAAPRLRRVLTTCDLVHCTVELYAPLVALAIPAGVPYVQNAHGTWAIRPLLHRGQRALFAPALRRVDRLLVLSRFTRDRMARLISLPPHEVLTGGVHPAAFEREAAVDLPAWAQEGPLVLSVGGVKARKGFHVALEAAALAGRERPGLQYVVIGDVEAKAAYAARLREIAPAADAVTRTYLAKFSLPEADERIELGMTATLTLTDPASRRVATGRSATRSGVSAFVTSPAASPKPIVRAL